MPRLGAEQLSAFVLSLDTGTMRALRNARIKYHRSLNTPSLAQVTIAGSYTSAGRTIRPAELPLRSSLDELVIYRTRNQRSPRRVWRGPITGWSENSGLLTISAHDELSRAVYLPVPKADKTGDAAMLVGRVLDSQIGSGLIAGFEIDYRPSGVIATYRVTDALKSFTLDALKPLEAKVGMTCIGDVLIVRGIDDHDVTGTFTEQNFAADIVTAQDFTLVPDQVVCYGADRLVGVYPPDAGLTFDGPVPIAKSVERPEAKTVAECVTQARFLYEALRLAEGTTIEVPNNATLNPDTEINFDDLVPGNVFRVAVKDRMQAIGSRLFKLVAVSGQQGNASDGRPRMPSGAFDKTAETNKEYVGVTLEAYSPAVAPPVIVVSVPTGGTLYPDTLIVAPGRGPAPQTIGGLGGQRGPAPPAGGIEPVVRGPVLPAGGAPLTTRDPAPAAGGTGGRDPAPPAP